MIDVWLNVDVVIKILDKKGAEGQHQTISLNL